MADIYSDDFLTCEPPTTALPPHASSIMLVFIRLWAREPDTERENDCHLISIIVAIVILHSCPAGLS